MKSPSKGRKKHLLMTFAEKIQRIRKKKGWSQGELAKRIGTSAPIVGRYERGEITPSIEVAAKIADALEVTLDHLIGNTDMELDKETLRRIEEMSKLPEKERQHILRTIDALIRDFKAEKAFSRAG